MTEEGDPRFEQLVEQAKEKDGLSDARWEALAQGELAEEESKKLKDHPYYDAFRPLDEAEQEALVNGVFAALDAGPKEGRPWGKEPETIGAKVVRPRAWMGRAALLLAAALGVVGLWILIRPAPPEPMAAYTLTVEGGIKQQRSDPSAPASVLKLDPNTRLAMALRPEKPVIGAVFVRGFLVKDGALRSWDAPAMVGAGGVVRIEGRAGALFGELEEGAWDIVIVVGRPEAMPDEKSLERMVLHHEQRPGLSVHYQSMVFSRPRGSAETTGGDEQKIGFSGCAALRSGAVCELGPLRTLRFFVPDVPAEKVLIRVDEKPLEASQTVLRGGVRVQVDVPKEARSLSISLDLPGDRRKLSLGIAEAEAMPAWLSEAALAKKQGRLKDAEKLLISALGDSSAGTKQQALRLKARIALASPGRFSEARTLFEEAIAEDKRAGRISDELDDTFALAFGFLLQERAFGEARSLLLNLKPVLEQCPEGKPKAAYYLGLIALETGDLRAALSLFGEAETGAERLGLEDYRSGVLEQQAELLSSLGRYADARQKLEQAQALAGEGAGACRRAELANNLGWLLLRAGAFSGEGLEEAKRILADALGETRKGCPAGLGNILINLALVEIYGGNAKAARGHAEEAKRAGGWAGLSAWQRMIEARLLLDEGKPSEALEAYRTLREEGERLFLPELSFEGALGRAEVFAALGKAKETREAHAEAARSLLTWGQNVPLGEGRATFLLGHRRAAQGAVEFLLGEYERGDKGAAKEAMETARRSLSGFSQAFHWLGRINSLSAESKEIWDKTVAQYRRERSILEERAANRGPGAPGVERERAQLRQALDRALGALGADQPALAELSSPGPDEALFVVHPLKKGLAAFLMMDGGNSLEVRRLPMVDRKASAQVLANAWISPFEQAFHRAKGRRLRLLLPGDLADMDWHTMPIDGMPLLEIFSVFYSLDLPAAPKSETRRNTALLVSDPTEDLPGARASAESVANELQARGMKLIRLEGQAATHEAVRDALASPELALFHYAGHAMFEGPDGLEAAFRLANRAHFSAADIMALTQVPDIVVLSGCETARSGDTKRGGGLGLAQAFLLKGAKVAVASSRPIQDTLAERATQLLYENRVEQDPAKAFQTAIKALRAESPGEDWASLRILGEGAAL